MHSLSQMYQNHLQRSFVYKKTTNFCVQTIIYIVNRTIQLRNNTITNISEYIPCINKIRCTRFVRAFRYCTYNEMRHCIYLYIKNHLLFHFLMLIWLLLFHKSIFLWYFCYKTLIYLRFSILFKCKYWHGGYCKLFSCRNRFVFI